MIRKYIYLIFCFTLAISSCQITEDCNDKETECSLLKFCKRLYLSPNDLMQNLKSEYIFSTEKILREIKEKPYCRDNIVELLKIHKFNNFEFYDIRKLKSKKRKNYYTYIITFKTKENFISEMFEGVFYYSEEKINYIFVEINKEINFDGISVTQHFPYGKFKN